MASSRGDGHIAGYDVHLIKKDAVAHVLVVGIVFVALLLMLWNDYSLNQLSSSWSSTWPPPRRLGLNIPEVFLLHRVMDFCCGAWVCSWHDPEAFESEDEFRLLMCCNDLHRIRVVGQRECGMPMTMNVITTIEVFLLLCMIW
jgi:hypothetical protein